MIPKIIHYCWFGGSTKPKLVKDCILSWKIFFPNYEIIEWNEKNSDLNEPFVKAAYNLKKWAFVSDYVRLTKVYEYGGLYLDTDMLIIKKFDTFFLDQSFFGAQKKSSIGCGIFGAYVKHPFIKKCIDYYSTINLDVNTDLNTILIPQIVTTLFCDAYKLEAKFDSIIIVKNLKIYPPEYFYSFPYKNANDIVNYKNYLKENSLAVHLWSSSWLVHSASHYFKRREYKKSIFKLLKSISSNRNVLIQYLKVIFSANFLKK